MITVRKAAEAILLGDYLSRGGTPANAPPYLTHPVTKRSEAERHAASVLAALTAPDEGLATPDRARVVALEEAAQIVERMIPPAAGGPFSHTNSMRVVLYDALAAIRALLPTPPARSLDPAGGEG